ncbi:hypothetical protein [Pseudomonas sp. 5Ae-yellow]|uniref:hypothetical protein n=1 Tax=Pseudomonas sp. 5Ae-yellow TaxID=2759848 RepID=UPI0015F78610|nr:hypothetical protein [Pseudomonas sp. 5Ae-yellow]MBA6421837.1 hypothetical protein [Pseudomonas sp. 5Ae-yellow]|tara:strand:- start:261 stop:629 length:369 start_codon:yes stop_codon:yes gene_type:complete
MLHTKETFVYSGVLSATALFFLVVPSMKGGATIGLLSIAIAVAVYFLLGFVGFWVGQNISGHRLLLKPVFWAAPLCFVVPYQTSKLTGINEVFPGADLILVLALAFLVGFRLNQQTVDKDII